MNKKIKVGYNWHYKFAGAMRDGKACVQVDEELWLLRHPHGGPEQIISEYPYGGGRREDSVADSIRDAFGAFYEGARESGVEVREVFGRWQQPCWIIVDTTIDDALVQGLIKALAHLNRVTVETTEEAI